MKYNKTNRLQTNVNNLARTLEAKVQQGNLLHSQVGKVVPSQLLVMDLWKQTDKQRELAGDRSAYFRQKFKLPYFLKSKMLLAFVLRNNSEN